MISISFLNRVFIINFQFCQLFDSPLNEVSKVKNPAYDLYEKTADCGKNNKKFFFFYLPLI